MARLEFSQLTVEVVLRRGRGFSGDYDDLPGAVDFYPADMHTGRSDGFDRPGHVLLPE